MLKRARWLTTGFLIGVGSSYAVTRRVRRTIHRYAPPEVLDRVGDRAGAVVTDLRGALSEGRDAMRSREAELRAGVGRRWQ
jgi:hypothetical protein